MGKNDSSKTRVVPIFDCLYKNDKTGLSWLSKLLSLPKGEHQLNLPLDVNLKIQDIGWGDNEKKLVPPVSLLSWLIRNPRKPSSGVLSSNPLKAKKREALINGAEECIIEGLKLLRNNPNGETWHIFEGETQPDVFIKTPDVLIVIEGKRTEREPTTSTKWMLVRHQMLRHIDCAFEIAGGKKVIGFFIVEGEGQSCDVPSQWIKYAKDTINSQVIQSSLPHRGPEEQKRIASSFIGVTTWQQVCKEFDIKWDTLPDKVEG